jgi:hypothetical protein
MSANIKLLKLFATNLRNVGEDQGAAMLERRAEELSSPVEILYSDNKIVLKTPVMSHRKRFYVMVSKLKGIESREWDKENEVNTFDKKDKPAVLAVIQNFYAGHTLVTPEGSEVIQPAS